MNRREFIKSLGIVSAGAVVAGGTFELQSDPEISQLKFEKALLKRFSDHRWILTFETDEMLHVSLQPNKELVAEIGKYKFCLKDIKEVMVDLVPLGEGRYNHWITGIGWEQLT